jgi:xanthosine utilization system XapX-like protein
MLNHELGFSLTPAFQLLAGIGCCSSVYLAQLYQYEAEDRIDPPWIRHSRRIALISLALSLCWAIYFSSLRFWEPWPPVVGIVASADLLIGVMIFGIRARVKRTGPYMHSPRQADIIRAASDKRTGTR